MYWGGEGNGEKSGAHPALGQTGGEGRDPEREIHGGTGIELGGEGSKLPAAVESEDACAGVHHEQMQPSDGGELCKEGPRRRCLPASCLIVGRLLAKFNGCNV